MNCVLKYHNVIIIKLKKSFKSQRVDVHCPNEVVSKDTCRLCRIKSHFMPTWQLVTNVLCTLRERWRKLKKKKKIVLFARSRHFLTFEQRIKKEEEISRHKCISLFFFPFFFFPFFFFCFCFSLTLRGTKGNQKKKKKKKRYFKKNRKLINNSDCFTDLQSKQMSRK